MKPSQSDRTPAAAPDGFAARQLAAALIEGVIGRRRLLDEVLAATASDPRFAGLSARDRGFARMIAATVLRSRGRLEHVLSRFIERPLPDTAIRAQAILLCGAAQLLLLGTPPHAAINLAVEQCRRQRSAQQYHKLANAVLRRVSREGADILARLDVARCDMPAWLFERWTLAWGEETARGVAAASLQEAALDITPRGDAAGWTERLSGLLLPTESIRLAEHAPIEELPGFADGAWWVQDAAAAMPARLLGDVAGRHVVDLCAAPGGKTAQLATMGAHVTAVDISAARCARVASNIERLRLTERVTIVTADVMAWEPQHRPDAILLDAPCTATGTIRRHPDILTLRSLADVERMAGLQRQLLDRAADLLPVGATLVYCTCSLEPEEGPMQIAALLERRSDLVRLPIAVGEIPGADGSLTPDGDLRTMPTQMPTPEPYRSGMDGFFAARLRKIA